MYLSLVHGHIQILWARRRARLETHLKKQPLRSLETSAVIFSPPKVTLALRSILLPLISILSNALCSDGLSCDRHDCDQRGGNSFQLASVRTGCWKQCQRFYFWSISKMTALIHFTEEPNSCQMAVSRTVPILQFSYAE